MDDENRASFERTSEIQPEQPTLIEGLPGLGMTASIAVDQITSQLGLKEVGYIDIDEMPPVAAFRDGRVREAVRVYAGESPDVMTLESDVPVPGAAVEPLADCVLEDVSDEFGRAVFLAGAPAESEAEVGEVSGVAAEEGFERDLVDAGVALAEGSGAVGGVTGGLLQACYRAEVPACVLIVRCNPYLPDPAAAESVIENALEPLVDFDVDTSELRDQAAEIQEQKERIVKQMQEMMGGGETESKHSPSPSMYQ